VSKGRGVTQLTLRNNGIEESIGMGDGRLQDGGAVIERTLGLITNDGGSSALTRDLYPTYEGIFRRLKRGSNLHSGRKAVTRSLDLEGTRKGEVSKRCPYQPSNDLPRGKVAGRTALLDGKNDSFSWKKRGTNLHKTKANNKGRIPTEKAKGGGSRSRREYEKKKGGGVRHQIREGNWGGIFYWQTTASRGISEYVSIVAYLL